MTLILEHPELEARLLAEATRRGMRPEEIALETLTAKFARRTYHDADFLINTLSEEDYTVFKANIATLEQVDETL